MIHIKDISRLRKILTVFAEEGLGYYITKAKLHSHLPFRKRIVPSLPLTDKQRQARRIRRAFERLGPTFVKLGQLLSLRPDLVPPEYSKEFEKLQDHVPSFTFGQVKKIIEEDLKRPLKKSFPEFEKKPFASASIAQVHEAILPSRKKVAVKIQRPNIKKTIDADLDILFHIAHSLEKHFPDIRNYRPVEVVKEFALWTRRELNFKIEAQNAIMLKEELKNNKNVKVPSIYGRFSSRRVLTMEFVEGVKIDDFSALKKFHISRKKIAMVYFTSILEQALLHGLFHADPHPANIFVQKNSKLVYFDYGIMGELDASDRSKIIRFIRSIPERNADKSLNIVISLARDTSMGDIPAFKKEALPILRETYQSSLKDKSFAYALYEVIGLGAKYNIIFDPNHVLMAKAVYQAEGLALKLDPAFKIADGLQVFADNYLKQSLSPLKVAGRMKKLVWSKKDLLLDLPDHVSKIIRNLEQPRPAPEINISQVRELEHEIEDSGRNTLFGVIIAALIIASALLFYAEGRTTLFGIPMSLVFTLVTLLVICYFFIKKRKNLNRKMEE